MKWVVIAAAASMLVGCNTKRVDEMSYTEVNQLAAVINKRCEDQGAKYPSREWDICTRQEVIREKTMREEAPRLQFNPDGAATALNNASAGYYRAASTYNSVAGSSATCTTVAAPTGMVSYRCR